jgi:predicted transcriptional regulator
MSSSEYRHLISRTINPNYGMHRLSIDEIFENQNRMNIIHFVLLEPGIHFNELKRRCRLQTGQLIWHLNILESYKIIQVQKSGQYNLYFPVITENPLSYTDIRIIKSKTTLKILKAIKEIPGVTGSQLARMFDLGRNTVKYHVDKLVDKKLLTMTKEGRKIKLFSAPIDGDHPPST